MLAGLAASSMPREEQSTEESMAELAALLDTAGGDTVAMVLQSRQTPDPRSFLGGGKLQEIKELIQAQECDLAVIDNELSPSQARVMEEELGVRVLDRSGLILDIFAQRAQTKEGRLQVELAQYQYVLPRLTGMWTHLKRQSGTSAPIGTRGPGETQLETDRRHIRRKIQKLEKEIDDLQKVRATQRNKREKSEVPLVCIVGYTNAGKSTMLNALTGAGVHANDRLFDTLDPTTRVLHTEQLGDILISDTVGFIRKLPHHLVDAFRSTLEELVYADVLVHVVDASDPQWRLQAEVVEELCRQLGAEKTPRLLVFNKVDLLRDDQLPRETGAIYTAASKGIGLENLVNNICRILGENLRTVQFILPYSQAGVLDKLYREANVKKAEYVETGIDIEAVVDPKTYGRIRDLLPEDQREPDHEEF